MPTEEELFLTAHDFAMDYRNFKTAGTEDVLKGNISSLLLPLLADHILQEANHYIRILEQAKDKNWLKYGKG